MPRFRFQLYVMGQTSRSRNAERQLRALCDSRTEGRYEIEVIDLAEHPELAEDRRIVATPTLDRIEPLPRIRVIGDLGPPERLMSVLDLPVEPATRERDP